MDENLKRSYTEVDIILSYMDKKYINKIPSKLRECFKNEKLEEYTPVIDPQKPLDKQNLQIHTLEILAMLDLNYWCESEEERKEIIAIYAENDQKREKEIREKYNPDNLFKNRREKKQESNNNLLIEYKEEKLFKRILNRIISFFKKK